MMVELSFKDLNQLTCEVAHKFFKAQEMLKMGATSFLNEQTKKEEESYDLFLKKVIEAFNSLSDLQKNLINNEFFYQSYHNWWKPIYSKASFYRYKKEAMKKFLGAIYGL